MFEKPSFLRPALISRGFGKWYSSPFSIALMGLLSVFLVAGCGSKEKPPTADLDPSEDVDPPAPGPGPAPEPEPEPPPLRSAFLGKLEQLNVGDCRGRVFRQEELLQPLEIGPVNGVIDTDLVVRIRERCVPVWVIPPKPEEGPAPNPYWEMQTLQLRTYGFPKDSTTQITESDADDPNSPNIAWSAPGPTFVLNPASSPGAGDGTRFKMRLYNRMPHDPDPHACVANLKCNTKGANPGFNPNTGDCNQPIEESDGGFPPTTPSQVINNPTTGDSQVIEPPNCFHGNNSTNFHFHGFHVSPQLGQDFVGLELRPPLLVGSSDHDMPEHGTHGEHSEVRYGHFDYDVDPLRYTQPPGTHWYHAHKHGSTALQVLNGLVGTFEVRGEFDAQLEEYFRTSGGGELTEKLMVIQQLQEYPPGLGGADHAASVLINGQVNPIVRMRKGEIQRWRFVGATMQASAALEVGFKPVADGEVPTVRQIAMDGVQFSPDNYECQPFLNSPDCTPKPPSENFSAFTSFNLSPGNRMDFLVRAPMEDGTHCVVYDVTSKLGENVDELLLGAQQGKVEAFLDVCGLGGKPPLMTLKVEDEEKPMVFPDKSQFPKTPPYLADIPPVTNPSLKKDIYYQMAKQGNLVETQFWINQVKYDPNCANETLVLDRPEEWTLWNNSFGVAHPFHIHQNPFQILSELSATGVTQEYAYPVWRDTLAIPVAIQGSTQGSALAPNSNPRDPEEPWGSAKIRYVAKEFTGGFVNHCHILGHEDRGMMHNTQSTCADGKWATTGPVPPGAECDEEGFCTSDCQDGERIPAQIACAPSPPQQSLWPAAYGYSPAE